MNPGNMVRVHLKQAILVGYSKEARYAKVLIGERSSHPNGRERQGFTIVGFVFGYQDYNLNNPIKMYLANSNILAIEDVKDKRAEVYCGPAIPPPTSKVKNQPVLTVEEHAKRITKLVLFSTAYGASREVAAQRVQEHLEQNFHPASKCCGTGCC